MMRKVLFIITIYCLQFFTVYSQQINTLSASKESPIFTAYAAPMERTEYTLDQAYEMQWNDPRDLLGFRSEAGGTLAFAFKSGDHISDALIKYAQEPLISSSYSDIVQMSFAPFSGLAVKACFNVYSSRSAIIELQITNTTSFATDLTVYSLVQQVGMSNIEYKDEAFFFGHRYERDAWMKKHNIPIVEDRRSIFTTSISPDEYYMLPDYEVLEGLLQSQRGTSDHSDKKSQLLVLGNSMHFEAGETKTLLAYRVIQPANANPDSLNIAVEELKKVDLNHIINKNEELFTHIPGVKFANKDYQLTYLSAFNLMRQCMMPPEGESSYNYYVFSREPKWGWGYGGQVFHESLVMLAYAFMDPISAMNSQRVYMERQDEAGFINYRTGPYLNENIPHSDQITSSAPWYNYQNLEIFNITKDTAFLREAYKSGKKYYEYYTTNRDTDNDGLAEWGAHAVLESVRDARVAVWDKVGWPSNFEGPDINSMLVMEAKALAEMATMLNLQDESDKFSADAANRSELINKYLWDPETAFFYNVDRKYNDFSFENQDDLKIKEIIGFLPLWAGVVDHERADSLLLSLTNKDEFWRNFGIPTLAADQPYYNPIGYWNGPVWVQWNYLIFRGLLDYGYEKEAIQLADKVMQNIIFHLKTDHTFWEFYSADDLQAGWNHTYIWTGIIARFLIDLESIEN